MTVTQISKQNAKILRLVGKFDFKARKEITTALTNAIQDSVSHIILNFQGVSYIDSAGLGMLGNFDDQFRNRHIKVSLVSLQPTVEKIITMARLEEKFALYPTEEDALSGKQRSLVGK